MGAAEAVRIVDLERRHVEAFRALNLEWIRAGFPVEPEDERQLGDPLGAIVAPGGDILVAVAGERVVGTCALKVHAPGELELCKFTVAPEQRGAGIGSALTEAALQRARSRGAKRVVLFTHTKLAAAVRLFRAFGFVETDLCDSPYEQANLAMVLVLSG